MWRNAVWLMKHDFWRAWKGYILTIIMTLYLGLVLSDLFNNLEAAKDRSPAEVHVSSLIVSILFISTLGSLGFNMSRDYCMYMKDDTFSKRVMFLRRLPIRPRELVLSRYIPTLITLLVMSAVFFTLLHSLSSYAQSEFTLPQYLSFCLHWFSYSLFMTGSYLYFEMGLKGSTYLKMNFAVIGFFLTVVLLTWWMGHEVIGLSIGWAKSRPLGSASIAILLGVSGWAAWGRLIEHRIQKRHFD